MLVLQMTVVVHYDQNETDKEELQALLAGVIDDAASNGTITGETPATIKCITAEVKELKERMNVWTFEDEPKED